MLTFDQVFAATPTSVIVGSKHVRYVKLKITPDLDYRLRKFPIAKLRALVKRSRPYGSGLHHRLELHVYDEQYKGSRIWASCDCESWLYRSEVAWSMRGSTRLNYSNGKLPHVRNPSFLPWACVHTVNLMSKALSDKRVARTLIEAKDLLDHERVLRGF